MRRIAAYWATDGEIDPAPLLRFARRYRIRVYLPVLRSHPQQKLWFVRHVPGERLIRNRFGIPEPDVRRQPIAPPWALDAILVPLVGFDAECRRLGMGGGFYDRTLAYLLHRRYWRRPTLIGLAHECQRVPALQAQPWDVPLDLVVTERAIYRRLAPASEQRPRLPAGPS